MTTGRSETRVRQELRDASDAVIEDAVVHADCMALRGLLYQLTGDEAKAFDRSYNERKIDHDTGNGNWPF